jgi:hypothetical protein
MTGSKALQFALSSTDRLLFTYSTGQLAKFGVESDKELFLVGTGSDQTPVVTDTSIAIAHLESQQSSFYDLNAIDLNKLKERAIYLGLYIVKPDQNHIKMSANDTTATSQIQTTAPKPSNRIFQSR